MTCTQQRVTYGLMEYFCGKLLPLVRIPRWLIVLHRACARSPFSPKLHGLFSFRKHNTIKNKFKNQLIQKCKLFWELDGVFVRFSLRTIFVGCYLSGGSSGAVAAYNWPTNDKTYRYLKPVPPPVGGHHEFVGLTNAIISQYFPHLLQPVHVIRL